MTTIMPPPPPETAKTREIDLINAIVARAHGIDVVDLVGPSRCTPLPEIRHVAMALARKLTGQSLPELTRCFRRGNHSSILHAVKATRERCQVSKEFAAKFAAVERKARIAIDNSRAEDRS